MKLNEISDKEGANPSRKRVGRGIGSGMGKTAGRGVKGQKSRSGVAIKGYEGGQMPIYRRLPKRGFSNAKFAKNYNIVSLERLQTAVDAGRLDAKSVVGAEALIAAGVIRRRNDGVRILSDGDIKAKLKVSAAGISKTALEKLEKAGGSFTTDEGKPTADAAPAKGKKAAKSGGDAASFVDDIVLIDGIGDKTAKALTKAGVSKLTEIVKLSDEDLAKISEEAGSGEQWQKQEWKVQAQEMIDGKPPRAKVDQDLAKKMAAKASK